MNDIDQTKATAAVQALREVADFIEANPEFADLADNTSMIKYTRTWDLAEGETVEDRFARYVRALGGERTKEISGDYFRVTRQFGPLEVTVIADRNEICERVVVGTETVEIPDPAAPKVTVEREVVEWECRPVLDGMAS